MKRNFTLLPGLCAALFMFTLTASGQENATSVSYEGKVYTFGGGTDFLGQPAVSNDVSVFDPLTGEMDFLQSYPPWPDARSGHSVSVNGDKMYVYGGKNANGVYLNDMWEFDMKNRTWRKIDPANPPMPRCETVQCCVGDVAYVCGGSFLDGTSQAYVHALNLATPTAWVPKAPMPEPLQSAGSFVHGGRIYVVGGVLDDWDASTPGKQPSYSKNSWQYNPLTNTWQFHTTTGNVPEISKFAIVRDKDGRVWVSGGVTYDYEKNKEVPLDGVGYYDPATTAWHYPVATNNLVKSSDANMVYFPPTGLKSTDKGKLYMIGGRQADGTITQRIVEYDIAANTFKEVYHPSGIDLPAAPGFSLSLFPNPADEEVTLSFTLSMPLELSTPIFDLSGRRVLEGPSTKEYGPGTHTLTLDISTLPAGIYAVRISSRSGTEIRKIMKR